MMLVYVLIGVLRDIGAPVIVGIVIVAAAAKVSTYFSWPYWPGGLFIIAVMVATWIVSLKLLSDQLAVRELSEWWMMLKFASVPCLIGGLGMSATVFHRRS